MGDWKLLQNIKLLVPEGSSTRKKSRSSNRKAAIVQLPPPQTPRIPDPTYPREVCPVHSKRYVSKTGHSGGPQNDRDIDDGFEDEKLCTECIREAEGPIVCDFPGSAPRLCSVSQGVTAERLRAFSAEPVAQGGFI